MRTYLSLLLLTACGGADNDTAAVTSTSTSATGTTTTGGTSGSGAGSTLQDGYDFPSAFADGSSVSYTGQIFRQLLIDDMKTHLDGLTERLSNGEVYPVSGDIEDELGFYFEFDSDTSGSVQHGQSWSSPALQSTYDEISSGKNLVDKLAGNDETGQHADWSTEFAGWQAPGVTTPESLVREWFAQIDSQAVDWSSGTYPLDPDGAPVDRVTLTADGLDLAQLLEKFLRGAVSFSQASDDYLDDDTDGKGLLSDHTAPDEGKPYTALEHAWDEGWGYFGAARTYRDWSDDQIADDRAVDANGDGVIDLTSEVCWGHSVNAAKRDRGSQTGMDLTADAWDAFHDGRVLLSETAGAALTDAELIELQGHRDVALAAWEAAVAATIVHYINDVLADMDTFGTDAYAFGDHAKHWSELKGFALGLQFNPRSPVDDAAFVELHAYLGMAPVLPSASPVEIDAYRAALLDARDLIGDAYGFDAADLGDDDGQGGW